MLVVFIVLLISQLSDGHDLHHEVGSQRVIGRPIAPTICRKVPEPKVVIRKVIRLRSSTAPSTTTTTSTIATSANPQKIVKKRRKSTTSAPDTSIRTTNSGFSIRIDSVGVTVPSSELDGNVTPQQRMRKSSTAKPILTTPSTKDATRLTTSPTKAALQTGKPSTARLVPTTTTKSFFTTDKLKPLIRSTSTTAAAKISTTFSSRTSPSVTTQTTESTSRRKRRRSTTRPTSTDSTSTSSITRTVEAETLRTPVFIPLPEDETQWNKFSTQKQAESSTSAQISFETPTTITSELSKPSTKLDSRAEFTQEFNQPEPTSGPTTSPKSTSEAERAFETVTSKQAALTKEERTTADPTTVTKLLDSTTEDEFGRITTEMELSRKTTSSEPSSENLSSFAWEDSTRTIPSVVEDSFENPTTSTSKPIFVPKTSDLDRFEESTTTSATIDFDRAPQSKTTLSIDDSTQGFDFPSTKNSAFTTREAPTFTFEEDKMDAPIPTFNDKFPTDFGKTTTWETEEIKDITTEINDKPTESQTQRATPEENRTTVADLQPITELVMDRHTDTITITEPITSSTTTGRTSTNRKATKPPKTTKPTKPRKKPKAPNRSKESDEFKSGEESNEGGKKPKPNRGRGNRERERNDRRKGNQNKKGNKESSRPICSAQISQNGEENYDEVTTKRAGRRVVVRRVTKTPTPRTIFVGSNRRPMNGNGRQPGNPVRTPALKPRQPTKKQIIVRKDGKVIVRTIIGKRISTTKQPTPTSRILKKRKKTTALSTTRRPTIRLSSTTKTTRASSPTTKAPSTTRTSSTTVKTSTTRTTTTNRPSTTTTEQTTSTVTTSTEAETTTELDTTDTTEETSTEIDRRMAAPTATTTDERSTTTEESSIEAEEDYSEEDDRFARDYLDETRMVTFATAAPLLTTVETIAENTIAANSFEYVADYGLPFGNSDYEYVTLEPFVFERDEAVAAGRKNKGKGSRKTRTTVKRLKKNR
ncbi:mucin-2-like [Uranotaenia lowii]|uniref:mucin-2-like n=1 Tax=Uranotaenia lowii TaxID=190385 RepID=UPI002479A9CC|nr:mucin-2-like [Uranotaenia lowii]